MQSILHSTELMTKLKSILFNQPFVDGCVRQRWLTWLLCNKSFSKSPRICMVVVFAWSRSRMAFCTCSLTVSEAWLRSISWRWIRFFHSSRSEASEVFSLANRSMVNSYCKHFSSTCRIWKRRFRETLTVKVTSIYFVAIFFQSFRTRAFGRLFFHSDSVSHFVDVLL